MAVNTHADADHHGGNSALKQMAENVLLACGEADRGVIEDPDRLFALRYNHWMKDHGVGLALLPEATKWVREMAGPAHSDRPDASRWRTHRFEDDRSRSRASCSRTQQRSPGVLLREASFRVRRRCASRQLLSVGERRPFASPCLFFDPGVSCPLCSSSSRWKWSGSTPPIGRRIQWKRPPSFSTSAAGSCKWPTDKCGSHWSGIPDGLTLRDCMDECGPLLGRWPAANQWLLMYPLHGHLAHLEETGEVVRVHDGEHVRWKMT